MKKIIIIPFCCVCLFCCFFVHAQSNVLLQSDTTLILDTKEATLETDYDELVVLADTILYSRSEASRFKANAIFIKKLVQFLTQPGSFEYSLSGMRTISELVPDNNTFKLITWAVAFDNGQYRFYGAIQYNTENLKIRPLIDATPSLLRNKKLLNYTLGAKSWYGTKYKEMIPVEMKGQKYYVLMGWKGIDFETTQRVIETLYFDEENEPRFGLAVLEKQVESPLSRQKKKGKSPFVNQHNTSGQQQKLKRFQKRVIFEHAQGLFMMFKYEKETKRILYDHLSPRDERMKGIFKFYGPDFTFDGFQLNPDGKWTYLYDLDLRNPPSEQDRLYVDPITGERIFDH